MLLLACVTLSCEKGSEFNSKRDTLDYASPDSSYSAGFDEIDGPDYTASKGIFDGDLYCILLEEPANDHGSNLSSLRRKDGIILIDIGGDAYALPGPGAYTLKAIEGE